MLNLEVIVVVGNRPGCADATMLTAGSVREPRPQSRRLHPERLRSHFGRSTTSLCNRFVKVPYLGRCAIASPGPHNRRKAHLMRHIGARQLVLIS